MSEKMPETPQETHQEKPESTSETPEKEKSGKQNRTFSIILGLLFILPALAALIFARLIPTFRTFTLSFQDASLFGDPQFIGGENYQQLLQFSLLGRTVTFTLLITLNRVLLVLIPPLIFGLGASSLKFGLRKAVRVFATVPWMLYSPLALGVTWLLLMNPMFGFATMNFNLGNPDLARWIILLMDGLSFFGLSCGIGITVYLAALKGENYGEGRKRPARTLIILAIIMVVGTAALTLQGGSTVTFLTNGGPQNMTMTINLLILNQAFSLMRMGISAAIASPVLLLVMLLGIGIVLISVLTNFRLLAVPPKTEPTPLAKWLKVLAIILMIVFLIGLLISSMPYLLKLIPLFRSPGDGFLEGMTRTIGENPFWQTLLNSWLVPVVIVLLVQFPITYLAAIGIGALRPFGKGSEWLLLLFAPWLFVTEILLIPGMTFTLLNLGLVNQFTGLALAYLINLPMLVVLTLFFRGQSQKLAADKEKIGFFKVYILPSLPLAAICVVVGIMAIQQDMVWSAAVLSAPNQMFLPVLFRRLRVMAIGDMSGLGGLMLLLRIPAFILSLLIFGAFQLFYFPRLGIKSGKEQS